MDGQMTIQELTEREIEIDDLPAYIGKRVHHYGDPEEYLHPEYAPDEYVTIERVHYSGNGEWLWIKCVGEDGTDFEIAMNTKVEHRSRMWEVRNE